MVWKSKNRAKMQQEMINLLQDWSQKKIQTLYCLLESMRIRLFSARYV